MLKSLYNHLFITLGNMLPKTPYFNRKRPFFYRLAGAKIGHKTSITGPLILRVDTISRLYIGSNSYLNSETRFGLLDSNIHIGNDVLIGGRVSFETANHNLIYKEKKGRGVETKPIVVGDKAWIGAGAIILGGTTIGERAVVAAGAVVTKSVEANTISGGVPSKLIRHLGEQQNV